MSRICYTFFIFISLFLVSAYTLNGGVSYTVETARIECFKDISEKIDMTNYVEHMTDRNFEENNLALRKKKKKYKNRYLTLFSDGAYSVSYRDKKNEDFYYDSSGKLIAIDFKLKTSYPQKSVKYDAKGNLDSICLWLENNEQYVFNKDKSLSSHWIGNNCYNEKGELIMTRK